MDDLVKDFLQESTENLDRLDQEFVQLETDPGNRDLLSSIFRTIHTIKGSCGFLGFTKLEGLTHAGESLLSLLRDGSLSLSPQMADALLDMVDAVRGLLDEIGASGEEGAADHEELVTKLKALQQQPIKSKDVDSAARERAPGGGQAVEGQAIEEQAPATASTRSPEAATPAAPKAPGKKAKPSVTSSKIGGALARSGRVRPEDITYALEMQQNGDNRRLGEILVALGLVTEKDIEEVFQSKSRAGKQEGTIRVDVSLLENQMNLVSELVLLRNRLLQKSSVTEDHDLQATVHGLNLVTSELRKNVMKARMQPVSQLYEKLPRVVRDVSKDLGKKIQLETAGGETELDKTLLEAIKDPVTHILRNSMDHGVESPEKRAAAGKSETGTIRIRAYHEGGNFHLQIADDGNGIDSARVRDKAISKGLITLAQAQKMPEAELQALVFAPGLSTAEKVTSVSGRGVGMDVVKTNIEQIGGRVKLESTRGKGTRVELEIPLTLATIPALTVVSGRGVFAIPQTALVEMLSLNPEESRERTQEIDGVQVLRFRGAVLPLLSLRREFCLDAPSSDDDFMRIVVVQAEGRRFALHVDLIRYNEEIVIKPLARFFKQIGLFSGAAILGDGSVALILDLAALARRSGMTLLEEKREEAATASRHSRRTLVLLSASHGERMAIPIECVERLESLPETAREMSGGNEVIQYRGEILRLSRMESLLDERRTVPRQLEAVPPAEEGRFAAVVVRTNATQLPVVMEVGRIVGIVNVETEKLSPATRSGVVGSLVIQERVTELLDVDALLQRALAAPLLEPEPASNEA